MSAVCTRSCVFAQIIYQMQDIFNLLPNTNTADLAKSFAVQTNDMMVVVYLSALIRSVIALHNLVNNRSAPLCIAHSE